MPKKITKTKEPKKDKYYESVGRRKTATARVRLFPEQAKKTENEILINEKSFGDYFPLPKLRILAASPLDALSIKGNLILVKVKGGGPNAQAEAIRLGISRALCLLDSIWKPRLKGMGYLKRDPRMVERKKPGLRKARRPQQWRKR